MKSCRELSMLESFYILHCEMLGRKTFFKISSRKYIQCSSSLSFASKGISKCHGEIRCCISKNCNTVTSSDTVCPLPWLSGDVTKLWVYIRFSDSRKWSEREGALPYSKRTLKLKAWGLLQTTHHPLYTRLVCREVDPVYIRKRLTPIEHTWNTNSTFSIETPKNLPETSNIPTSFDVISNTAFLNLEEK